jgi:PAS domain S-box-containing protein
MLRRRLLTFLILCVWGVLLGTLGTWSWKLGYGFSAVWPALVVQIAGGIWFGGWGVLAAMLFPIVSNALAGVGPLGIIGYIPANLMQGLLPAWAFRHFHLDPALPGRKGLLSFVLWGAIVPPTGGAIIGAAAVVLFGQASWSTYPSLVWKWAAPHYVVAIVIGIPVMRIFTPLWRDLGATVSGWWGLQSEPAEKLSPRTLGDLPIQLKLVLCMCIVGLGPLLALSLFELSSRGMTSRPVPLFLTLSLVAVAVTVGWLSGEVIRPLLYLKDRVEHLMQGRGVSLGISRGDEIGRVASAFEALLEGRRQAEQEVRRTAGLLQSFVQTAPFGITRASVKEDRFLSINPALIKMLGYDSEADVLALRLSRDIYVDAEGRSELLAQLSPIGEYRPVEIRWKRRDGKAITVRVDARMIPAEPGSEDLIIEATEEDITQQRLLEERLQQAEKMEAVGQLAGGVAHDFNNLLGVIIGYGELLAQDLSANPQQLAKLEAMLGAAERAAGLTAQLLAFSRKQVLQLRPVNLNMVVSDTQKILHRLIGENIELVVRLHSGLADIKADPGQIAQVVMNLAVNARDAMPRGGTLTIETGQVNLDRELVHESGSVPAGRYAVLKVADIGVGMDASTRTRIFEPFFTTKDVGKGTGLGLATVYGIVAQSAGHILVHTELGRGTYFEIFFPQVSRQAPQFGSPPTPLPAANGDETVLLVEDAEDLREVLRHSLEMRGYTVLVAASVSQALILARQHPGPIHLLLTDIVMPEMSGTELAERIAAIRPTAKILYMSGYSQHASVRQDGVLEGPNFLQKPFSLDALAQKLREVLTAPPAQPPETHCD